MLGYCCALSERWSDLDGKIIVDHLSNRKINMQRLTHSEKEHADYWAWPYSKVFFMERWDCNHFHSFEFLLKDDCCRIDHFETYSDERWYHWHSLLAASNLSSQVTMAAFLIHSCFMIFSVIGTHRFWVVETYLDFVGPSQSVLAPN